MRNGRGSKAWPVRPASGHHRGGSDEEDDLAAGASRLEIAVGVGRGGEGIVSADVGLEDAVTQRGEHVAGHRVQVFRGVRAMTGPHPGPGHGQQDRDRDPERGGDEEPGESERDDAIRR